METGSEQLTEIGLLKLKQIIGDQKMGIMAIYPVSKSAWYAGIKAGVYPKPVKLGDRARAWRVSDIRRLLETIGDRNNTPHPFG